MLEFKGGLWCIKTIICCNWELCRYWWLDDKTVKELGLLKLYGDIRIFNAPKNCYRYYIREVPDISLSIGLNEFYNHKVNRGAVLRGLRG